MLCAESLGVSVSVNDFVIKAVAAALHQVPEANGECNREPTGELKHRGGFWMPRLRQSEPFWRGTALALVVPLRCQSSSLRDKTSFDALLALGVGLLSGLWQ